MRYARFIKSLVIIAFIVSAACPSIAIAQVKDDKKMTITIDALTPIVDGGAGDTDEAHNGVITFSKIVPGFGTVAGTLTAINEIDEKTGAVKVRKVKLSNFTTGAATGPFPGDLVISFTRQPDGSATDPTVEAVVEGFMANETAGGLLEGTKVRVKGEGPAGAVLDDTKDVKKGQAGTPKFDFKASGKRTATGTFTALILTGSFTFTAKKTGDKIVQDKSFEVAIFEGKPTLIELSSFTATADDAQVFLDWTTGAEIDNEGFNLLRSEVPDGPYIKINDTLIPAKGISPSGANYEFVDTTVENGNTYFYKLEDVDTSGKKTQHGPLEITVIEGNTASLDISTETQSGSVISDTGGESSSGFGCGFIKPDGTLRPPSSGEMAGTLLVLSLPFILVLLRRMWQYRRSFKVHPHTPIQTS